MSIKEAALERRCCNWAEQAGWFVFKVIGRRGMPDRCLIRDGKVLFVEFKAAGRKPNELQVHYLYRLNRKGIRAVWISCWSQFMELMNDYPA